MVIVGAAAGYLASIVVGTNKQQGCLADILVGLVGSIIGGFVGAIFLPSGLVGGLLDRIIFATIGAVLLLIALQVLTPKRRRRRR
jgi:uncharacterized membrane protein YeaQ/YmgE (transglycosylase-associated protein family)